jgi:hypothetical protein
MSVEKVYLELAEVVIYARGAVGTFTVDKMYLTEANNVTFLWFIWL